MVVFLLVIMLQPEVLNRCLDQSANMPVLIVNDNLLDLLEKSIQLLVGFAVCHLLRNLTSILLLRALHLILDLFAFIDLLPSLDQLRNTFSRHVP